MLVEKKKRSKTMQGFGMNFILSCSNTSSHTRPTRGYFVYLRSIILWCEEYFCARLGEDDSYS